jgi:hypothetical protein
VQSIQTPNTDRKVDGLHVRHNVDPVARKVEPDQRVVMCAGRLRSAVVDEGIDDIAAGRKSAPCLPSTVSPRTADERVVARHRR